MSSNGGKYTVTVADSVEAVPANEWNGVVERARLGSLLHRHEWLRAVEGGFDREPKHLLAHKDTNLVGLLPNFVAGIDGTPWKRLESTFYWHCGPLATTDEYEVLQLFVDAVPEVVDDDIISHLIRTDDPGYVQYHHFLSEAGYEPSLEDCRIVVDLTVGWEQVSSNMSSSRRRAIRKGRKQQFDVDDEDVTRETLAEFYDGYRAVIDRLDGNLLPWSFIERLTELDDRVKLFSLTVDGTNAGSYLYLLDEERSTVCYFLSAVPQSAFEYNASELLHEHAMKWGIDNGYRTYDMGLTSANFEYGLFSYKMSYGGRVVPAVDWECGIAPTRWALFKVGREAHDRSERLKRALPVRSL